MPHSRLILIAATLSCWLAMSGCASNPPVVAPCPKPPPMPPSVMGAETGQDMLERMIQILDQHLPSTGETPSGSGSRSERASSTGPR